MPPKPKPEKRKKRKGGGLLITPADTWFSRCVRERADWTCEYPGCGKRYAPPTQALHCAHYYSRGRWATRLEPLGAMSMCYGHHRYIDGNDAEKERVYIEIFGQAAFEILKEKDGDIELGKIVRRTHGVGEIAKHYEDEYNRMMSIRAMGVTGRIDFVGYN